MNGLASPGVGAGERPPWAGLGNSPSRSRTLQQGGFREGEGDGVEEESGLSERGGRPGDWSGGGVTGATKGGGAVLSGLLEQTAGPWKLGKLHLCVG